MTSVLKHQPHAGALWGYYDASCIGARQSGSQSIVAMEMDRSIKGGHMQAGVT